MGRSQRHLVTEQGHDSTGAAHAQGAIAEGLLVQAGEDPITYGAELQSIEGLEVPEGPDGGPLQGSTLTGAIPADLSEGGGGTDPEPEPGVLTITSPAEGATVPPIHDIIGVGADPDAPVDLAHAGTVVASGFADATGAWGFTGDTQASLGDVTWVVRSSGQEAYVNIHVVEEEPAASRSKTKAKKGK